MKHISFVIDSEKVERFLKTHNEPIFCSLVYGSDEGAVKIITETIISKFFNDAREMELGLQKTSYHDVIHNLADFNDFFNSNSLFSSKKLLLVEGCGENFNQEILQILQNRNVKNAEFAVIFVADDIRKNSKIVKNIESLAKALVVPCYKPDHRSIVGIITNWLQAKMVSYENQLPHEMAMVMPANRLLIENELEKLILYCGNQRITVQAVNDLFINYSAEASIDYLANLFFRRNIKLFLLEFTKIDEKNRNNILILRTMQNYAVRLKYVKELLSDHKLEEALSKLSPPIFFKHKDDFISVLKNIELAQLNEILYQLLILEASIKKDGMANKDDYLVHSLCKLMYS